MRAVTEELFGGACLRRDAAPGRGGRRRDHPARLG